MANAFSLIKDVLIGRGQKDYMVPDSPAAKQYKKMYGPTPTEKKLTIEDVLGWLMVAPIKLPKFSWATKSIPATTTELALRTKIKPYVNPTVRTKLSNLWKGSKLLRGWTKWVGIWLGTTAGIWYVKNKVLEAEDAYNYDPNISQTKKTTPTYSGGGSGGGSKNTVTTGVSTPDPYANWKASDIERSTRPEWTKSLEPVLLPGTTKKISQLWEWTDLLRAFGEYSEHPIDEQAKVDNTAIAKFFQKVKTLPKEDMQKFIERYKSR